MKQLSLGFEKFDLLERGTLVRVIKNSSDVSHFYNYTYFIEKTSTNDQGEIVYRICNYWFKRNELEVQEGGRDLW